ncbi:MAG: hypothetical protein U1E62_24665 [Alsobacter sp.]
MTEWVTRSGPARAAGWKVVPVVMLALAAAACQSLTADSPVPVKPPTQTDITGLKPVGKVALTETFVAGAGLGKGVLTFKGKTYPFKLVGTVVGPGSLSKVQVSGEVYKLENVADFSGPWVQGTGQIGLQTSGAADLWLENKAGVIMHLVGKTEGITLGLGEDELLIELSK